MEAMGMRLSLIRPDDWHLHLRDGDRLRAVVAHTASQFGRAIVMPNLAPPVETVEQALAYRARILDARGSSSFQPLMTLYLTERTSPEEIRRAAVEPAVHAVKLYPAGATTHSEAGVQRLSAIYPVLEVMAEVGLPLLVHGETTDPAVDVFDRETHFVNETLAPLCARFTELKVVLEHITTRDAVRFVETARPGVAATITAHHLLYNRNALFKGGIRPDFYCLPILKREEDRTALIAAATSGNPRFFLGTDSAPHPATLKYAACGCAGIYTAHAALPLYAEAFESAAALPRLEAFASFHGPDFYGLPRNVERIELVRESWRVPATYDFRGDRLTPLRAGESVAWRVVEPAPDTSGAV
jgi:dihydroorotase